MAYFAGPGMLTTMEFAVDDDAAADTGADGQIEHVLATLAGTKAVFGQTSGVGVVGDDGGNAEMGFTAGGEREFFPAGEVHRQTHGTAIGFDGATKRYAHGANRSGDLGAQGITQRQHGSKTSGSATGRGRTALRGDHGAADRIDDAGGEFGATKVQA